VSVEPVPTPSAPPVAGPYSPAVRAGDWIVTAGQIGIDGAGRLAEGVEAQARQVLANLAAVLADCGTDWGHVAKTTIFLTDLGNFSVVNGLYLDAIGPHRPARSTIGVAALPAGAEVEIECWVHHPA
jgi:2-iminobutanoate/2-iminopropanoate deaminase